MQAAQIARHMKYGDQISPMSNLSHGGLNLETALRVVFNNTKNYMARSKNSDKLRLNPLKQQREKHE